MDISWIITPLSGAVIGYFTNWLAIKMLFRPRAEKRLFGVRLPFTPELIPKEKHQLSKTIGQTLAKNVLTEDELVEAVSSPAVLDKLVSLLDGFLFSFTSGAYAERIDSLCETAAKWLANALTDTEGPVNAALVGLIKRAEQSGIVTRLIDALRANERHIDEYLPADLPESAARFITEKSPDFIAFLKELPDRYPDIDERLNRMVQKIAEDNFGSFLGIFLKYDQIYGKIKTSLFNYLEDPDNMPFIAEKAGDFLRNFTRTTVGGLMGKIPGQTLDGVASRLSEKAAGIDPSELIKRFVPDPQIAVKSLLLGAVNAAASGLNGENAAKFRDMAISALKTVAGKGGAYVVSAIHFDELVENKINAFSVEEAEKLIVSVVDRELKAITWVGGVLGLVIGFVPLVTKAFGL